MKEKTKRITKRSLKFAKRHVASHETTRDHKLERQMTKVAAKAGTCFDGGGS